MSTVKFKPDMGEEPYDDEDLISVSYNKGPGPKKSVGDNVVCKIIYDNGSCLPIKKVDLNVLMNSSERSILYNSRAYFPNTKTLISFDENGYKVGALNGGTAEGEQANYMYTENHDPWGNEISFDEEIEEDKTDSTKPVYTFDHVQLMLSDPRKYRKSNVIVTDVLNTLINTMIVQPDQFDEMFTVEEGVPESPLLRTYMVKLAELATEEMAANKGSLSEDYLTNLGRQAYEFAGYEGKDLDTVNEEAKDYTNYMRFLLTKGDNIIISEEERNLAYKFRRNIEEDRYVEGVLGNIAKKTKNVEVKQELIKDMLFGLTFPILRKSSTNIYVYHFVGSLKKELKDFDFEKDNFHLRLSMGNEILLKKYAETAKLKIETYVIVCDKNANYTQVLVRLNSLSKWKKELYTLLNAFIEKLSHPSDVRPYGAPIEI